MMPPSPGLRVLMTTDAVGGVWTYAVSLAGTLAQRGHRVHLVVMGPPARPHQLAALRLLAGVTVETTDLALEWLDPEATDLARAERCLGRIADDFRPDLIHLNSYREARFGFAAPVLVAAHSCVPSWWLACRGNVPDEARWQLYATNAKAGLANATVWLAPTAAHREVVQQLYAPPKKGLTIHNGVAPLGAAEEHARIVAAGRLWDEAKNIGALTYAARHLPWRVRVAGPVTPPDAPNVTLGAAPLETLGELSQAELRAELRRAAIFVSPALYEPFGLAVLEAASAGCALVLADLASFRELWGGAALFVNPRDAQAIHATLDRLCRDQALRGALQAAAASRSRRYSLTAMTDGYLAAYHGLFPSRSQPPSPSKPGTLPEVAA